MREREGEEVKARPFSIKRNYVNFQYEINYALPPMSSYMSLRLRQIAILAQKQPSGSQFIFDIIFCRLYLYILFSRFE